MLTNENYFSQENNLAYMSATQFKSFRNCEAAALAELCGEYVREKTTALLVGSYVDAHFSSTLDLFKAKNPEIFKRDGSLKSEYEQANYIINRIESDRLFSMLMEGRKQVIKIGQIAGVPFKIKIDCLLDADMCREVVKAFPLTAEILGCADGANVDMKIMRDFAPIWNDEAHAKQPFVEAWGYQYQGAIYQTVEGGGLPFLIAGATKEKEPDLAILSIPQSELDAALVEVEDSAPKYADLKRGIGEPVRCEKCDYCRRTRKLTKIIDYREI